MHKTIVPNTQNQAIEGLRLVEIGSCCTIVSGSTPSRDEATFWNGDINWFTPKDLSNLDSKYVFESPEKINEKGYKSCSTSLLPPYSLLLTSRAPIGHVAINKLPACTNQGFKSLIPNKEVDVNYLFYVIKKLVPKLQDLGNGATFKELSKATLSRVQIPLPPIEIQQKIAEVLDKADAIRRRNQLILEKYDQLLQAIFLDMFGDPVKNEKSWNVAPLRDLGRLISGGTPSRNNAEFFKGSIPWVTTVALGSRKISTDNAVEYITEEAIKNSSTKLIPKDSIMIGVRVGVGKASITTCEMCTNQDILSLVDIDPFVNKSFLLNVFQCFEKYFNSQKRGATIQGITSETIKRMLIILPPIELQNHFAQVVENVERQKAQAHKSLQRSENLFQSLLQRAFKGELFTERDHTIEEMNAAPVSMAAEPSGQYRLDL